ncbi:MAG: adenylyl-sulfate kinase [Candidatus Parabeggiatoa sp. nov. 3]|nr:MAG: adenylyl-sulfate kinase [Gammaproteobacteria bacterium]RKZ65895.1 MAG: adenylyl-sulfate kinase [Gammaproteobacteria bacterium]
MDYKKIVNNKQTFWTKIIGTIWITGITASGKTTLGSRLYSDLLDLGCRNLEFLDGDELRKRIGSKYGHSLEDRFNVLEQIVALAKKLSGEGKIIIVSTVSHKRAMREFARKELKNFIEVYLECRPEICAKRDYKGVYEKAKRGEGELFVGVTEDYELSDAPDLLIHTSNKTPEKCSKELLNYVLDHLQLRE